MDNREEKLAQALEPDGVRTPGSDLFRELADPEFRYCFIQADKKTQGELYNLYRKPSYIRCAKCGGACYAEGDLKSTGKDGEIVHIKCPTNNRKAVAEVYWLKSESCWSSFDWDKPFEEANSEQRTRCFAFADQILSLLEPLSDEEIKATSPTGPWYAGCQECARRVSQATIDKNRRE